MKSKEIARKFIIGIDEAGRGPLAGPVVVAGVLMSPRLAAHVLVGIKDSKQLSAKQREAWYDFLTGHSRIRWAVSRISPVVIDRINIYKAAIVGCRRVHKKLVRESLSFPYDRKRMIVRVLLDGGLVLSPDVPYETIIKGDELIPIISAASIIAKVTRDRIMLRLHKKYPQYRFDLHKGYGTKLHREMVRKFGKCEIHRKSFSFH